MGHGLSEIKKYPADLAEALRSHVLSVWVKHNLHMGHGFLRNKETELRALEMRARCAMQAMAGGGSARAQTSAEAITSETRNKHQITTEERIGSLK